MLSGERGRTPVEGGALLVIRNPILYLTHVISDLAVLLLLDTDSQFLRALAGEDPKRPATDRLPANTARTLMLNTVRQLLVCMNNN